MPTAAGPNTALDNSIVFSYDTGDTSNSYKGEPTVNYYGDIDSSIALRTPSTEYNTSNWTANFSKPPLNIGRVYKHTSGALSSTWSGNSYGYTLKNYTYPAGAIYTLSAWVYVSPDCNISQLNISIEGGGTWVDNNYLYDLNKKGTWQRIWLEINTLSGFVGNAIPIYPQRWGVTDGSFTGFYAWGGAMLEAKDHITQYTVGTRSSTQGLLPLLGNTSINLSNVSFDSNAQIVFDGTDDRIDLGNLGTIGTTYSIECVFNSSAVTSYRNLFDMNYETYPGVTGNTGPRLEQTTGAGINIAWSGVTTDNNTFTSTTNFAISANTNYHVIFVQNGNSGAIYVNGILRSQVNNTYGYLQTFGDVNLGRGFSLAGDRYFIGTLPIFKIYNTALSTDQVQQNYRQYKSRFNLS
jgi:hypothetical protein